MQLWDENKHRPAHGIKTCPRLRGLLRPQSHSAPALPRPHRLEAGGGGTATGCPSNQRPPCVAQRRMRWCAMAKGGGTKKPSGLLLGPAPPPDRGCRYGLSGDSDSLTACATSAGDREAGQRACGSATGGRRAGSRQRGGAPAGPAPAPDPPQRSVPAMAVEKAHLLVRPTAPPPSRRYPPPVHCPPPARCTQSSARTNRRGLPGRQEGAGHTQVGTGPTRRVAT